MTMPLASPEPPAPLVIVCRGQQRLPQVDTKSPHERSFALGISGPALSERRTNPRSDAQIEIRYGLPGEEFVGTTTDHSAGGVGIVGSKIYPIGTELVLRFRRNGGNSDLITMNAVVRNTQPTRMGLQFVNVKPSEHPRLMAIIVQLLANAAVQRAPVK